MNKKTPYILLLPITFLSIIFIYGVLNVMIQSFGYIPAFNLNSITLDYYIKILSDKSFLDSLALSLGISLVSSIIAAVFGTTLAASLVYTNNTKGKAINIIKLAIVVPHTIVALFAVIILSQNGLIARFFYKLGLINAQSEFPLLLYTKNNLGIVLAYIWKEIPFVAYFCLSLMSSIEKTLGEAAENLGASKLKSFFYISLPLSMPSIKKAFLIILVFSFGAYDLPYLLGSTVPKALPVKAHIEYMHPDLHHRPFAMAMNGLIIIISFLMAISYYILDKRKKTRGDIIEK